MITFVEKYRTYLGSALAWQETYSMDQSYIGRWIVRLDGYHMIIEHRTRDKHQNADNLSKKTRQNSMSESRRSRLINRKSKTGFHFWTRQPTTNCHLLGG